MISKTLQRNGETIIPKVFLAENFFERFRGLMGRPHLPEDEGMLIPNCAVVHMFFMKMPLDLLFIDSESKILCIQHGIRPWKISHWVPGSKGVIELSAGSAERRGLSVGDVLRLV